MDGKLIKVENGWVLMVNNIMYATDNDKLSLKNCQAIANGYDLDELASSLVDRETNASVDSSYRKTLEKYVKIGFQKALELLHDKKFGEEDIYNALDFARANGKYRYEIMSDDEFIQSIQPKEWDVTFNPDEKDSEGCIILKRL